VVELWFYTPAVGGSIPSAPTTADRVPTVCRRAAVGPRPQHGWGDESLP